MTVNRNMLIGAAKFTAKLVLAAVLILAGMTPLGLLLYRITQAASERQITTSEAYVVVAIWIAVLYGMTVIPRAIADMVFPDSDHK